MSLIAFFRKIFFNPFNKNSIVASDENIVDVELSVPSTRKRRRDENAPELTVLKRKKLSSSYLNIGLENNTPTSRLESLGLSVKSRCKNNNLCAKQSAFVNVRVPFHTKPRNGTVYSIDDDDDEIFEIRNKGPLIKESNVLKEANNGFKFNLYDTRGLSANRCNRPQFLLNKIHQEQGLATYVDMMKKSAGSSVHRRKPSSSSKSKMHNSKLSDQTLEASILSFAYSPPQMLPSSLKQGEKSLLIDLTKQTVSDKTVIDLTNDEEDDEKQRQIIEASVINSPRIRNFRSSFIGKDVLDVDPNLITNLVEKHKKVLQDGKIKVQQVKKRIRENETEFHNTLAEILDKKLNLKEHVDDSEYKPPHVVAPITKAMIGEINKIKSSRRDPLVQIKDTGVKLQDIYTLADCAWLNDEVVNAYMNLIRLRAENNPKKYPKVHCYNTFLYEQLLKRGYSSVRRWTKRVDIFDHALIIIPIHLGNHWCLIEIRIAEKQILYYDSLGSPNKKCLETIMQYLVDEYQDKKTGLLDSSKWNLVNVPKEAIPKQENAYDCGVFACVYAEHLTRKAPLNFGQQDMQYFRLKMTYEILTGQLLL